MNPIDVLTREELAVAEAIQPLAQRAAGMMPVAIPLAEEDGAVFDACVAAAKRAVAALDALPPEPRARGPLNAADAQPRPEPRAGRAARGA